MKPADYNDTFSEDLFNKLEERYESFELTESEAMLYVLLKRLWERVEHESMKDQLRYALLSMPIREKL